MRTLHRLFVDDGNGTAGPSPLIWALTDRRPGTAAQVLGVAEALGLPYVEHRLGYGRLAALTATPALAFHFGLDAATRQALAPPWPDLVVAAGRRAARIALYIGERSRATRLVQIMHPGRYAARFDVVALPLHDRTPDTRNVVRTLLAPTRISAPLLAAAAARWQDRLGALPRPRIALLIGGATGHRRVARPALAAMVETASAMARAAGGSLLVTTSRRTDPATVRLVLERLRGPHHFHRWTREAENPYLAYLALADGLVVTGDSVSMCSEACATGRPVYIFADRGWGGRRARLLHESLFRAGVARPFDGTFETWTYTPPDAAAEIAAALRERLGLPHPEVS